MVHEGVFVIPRLRQEHGVRGAGSGVLLITGHSTHHGNRATWGAAAGHLGVRFSLVLGRGSELVGRG